MAPIRTIGVVGTGVIGSSWTALFLARGYHVLVADPGPGAAEKLALYLQTVWPTLESLGFNDGASLKNYQFVGSSLGRYYQEVDFIQENAPEQLGLKSNLLHEIDLAVRPHIIIASSSSGLPSSRFVDQCKHPERILIGHPFNPPHLMPLVEVVPHPQTCSTTINNAIEFYRRVGQRPILVRQETPGFVTNRLQAALVNEAFSLVSRGIISAEDLDDAVTTSLGPRWAVVGPFMANAMGGGGGVDGFRNLLKHIGPASKVWLEDMRAHAFVGDMENVEILCESVREELEGKNMKALEKQRDYELVGIFKLKRNAPPKPTNMANGAS